MEDGPIVGERVARPGACLSGAPQWLSPGRGDDHWCSLPLPAAYLAMHDMRAEDHHVAATAIMTWYTSSHPFINTPVQHTLCIACSRTRAHTRQDSSQRFDAHMKLFLHCGHDRVLDAKALVQYIQPFRLHPRRPQQHALPVCDGDPFFATLVPQQPSTAASSCNSHRADDLQASRKEQAPH